MPVHRVNPRQPPASVTPRSLVLAFPAPGRRVELAYRELDIAMHGTPEQKSLIGDPRHLPRPFDPPTCHDPELRAEIWEWLEHVVTWLNHEYTWDPDGFIPPCWPQHPHLFHDIATLADQRRRAGHALISDPLEEWHRYALPAFTDRVHQRLKTHCDDTDHQPWPAQARHTRHRTDSATARRRRAFGADVESLVCIIPREGAPEHPLLHPVGDDLTVNSATGEVHS